MIQKHQHARFPWFDRNVQCQHVFRFQVFRSDVLWCSWQMTRSTWLIMKHIIWHCMLHNVLNVHNNVLLVFPEVTEFPFSDKCAPTSSYLKYWREATAHVQLIMRVNGPRFMCPSDPIVFVFKVSLIQWRSRMWGVGRRLPSTSIGQSPLVIPHSTGYMLPFIWQQQFVWGRCGL